MRFGAVDLAEALGAVLAHSVGVTGKRLRKGRVLSQEDITALKEAEINQVIVARLDANDVGENDAAAALAQAVLGDATGLDVSAAFTGRVNLIARGAGVVELDVAALERINDIDPMITIATVPPFQQMAAGGMVATIKIISYAVDADALAQTVAAAAGGAIGFAPPVLRSASLIITEIPGGAGDKGRDAIANRLTALNVELAEVIVVPHEGEALKTALSKTTTDLTLILTGSATSDPYDVAPEALRNAGGQVARFGMPVDPGNLLFIGDLAGRPVIGLPGCARSPALNGADWVLSRVICGVPVTSGDIAGMGIGGLLKEIPTRPQPRRAKGQSGN